jgi:hypothetical protein
MKKRGLLNEEKDLDQNFLTFLEDIEESLSNYSGGENAATVKSEKKYLYDAIQGVISALEGVEEDNISLVLARAVQGLGFQMLGKKIGDLAKVNESMNSQSAVKGGGNEEYSEEQDQFAVYDESARELGTFQTQDDAEIAAEKVSKQKGKSAEVYVIDLSTIKNNEDPIETSTVAVFVDGSLTERFELKEDESEDQDEYIELVKILRGHLQGKEITSQDLDKVDFKDKRIAGIIIPELKIALDKGNQKLIWDAMEHLQDKAGTPEDLRISMKESMIGGPHSGDPGSAYEEGGEESVNKGKGDPYAFMDLIARKWINIGSLKERIKFIDEMVEIWNRVKPSQSKE